MLPQRILVPIDGSPHSVTSLGRALELAGPWGARVLVLQVIEPILYPGLPTMPAGGMAETLAQHRFEPVEQLLRDTQVPWERKVIEGMPADVICRVAKEGGFDLIVIGSHGAGAVERFFFGSVADRVVHHAHCDTLVVREQNRST